jgi:NAD(P)-dependent dehydrogenase (short-subunit alcohol dehydrogenase family)
MSTPVMSLFDLRGRTALVTGGSRGLGLQIAEALGEAGAKLMLSSRKAADLEHAVAALQDKGIDARWVAADASAPEGVQRVVDETMQRMGGIDILVNNAAQQATFKDIEDIPDEEWDRTFRVNIHAMFYLTKAAVRHMPKGGVIINTASINSDDPNPSLLPYATTKGAIHNFTAGLAQLLAKRGIRANTVAPGPIWTPLIPSTMGDRAETFGDNTPMKRPGQPAELATAYVMLADPLSSYVSGATIAVTGGRPFL